MECDEDGNGRANRGFKPNVAFPEKQPGARSFVLTPEGAFLHQDGKMETLADAVDFFWAGVSHDPADWAACKAGYDYLLEHAGDATREDVRRTLNWLLLAIDRRDRGAVVAAARYLARIPDGLLAADYGRLLDTFNSRVVGMVWQATPDLDFRPLPPRIPKFGREVGFGLIRSVPELYLKLALFGTEMEDMVASLAAEALRYGISLPPDLAAMAPPPSATG